MIPLNSGVSVRLSGKSKLKIEHKKAHYRYEMIMRNGESLSKLLYLYGRVRLLRCQQNYISARIKKWTPNAILHLKS
jgi:hypothetical protein